MFQIVKTAKYWASLSILFMIASVGLWLTWGLNLGIDFTGGSAMELRFLNPELRPTVEQMGSALKVVGIENARVQEAGESNLILRMQNIDNTQRQDILDIYADIGVSEESFTSVGPALGEELQQKAIVALGLVLLAIIGFVTYAFRKVSRASVPSWVFGLGAVVALGHDILLTVGAFIVLGHFFGVQIDAYFVTALLTILGFSVNDTIVVYDRIREGLKDRARKSFREIINESINTTLARSINTSLTTLLVLVALFLFGGESIRYLVLALMFGITFGTYSSIFIASPLLLVAERWLKPKRRQPASEQ